MGAGVTESRRPLAIAGMRPLICLAALGLLAVQAQVPSSVSATIEGRPTIGGARAAWVIAMLLNAFVDNLKQAGTKLESKEEQEEAKVNAKCTARRTVMLEETLSRMKPKRD